MFTVRCVRTHKHKNRLISRPLDRKAKDQFERNRALAAGRITQEKYDEYPEYYHFKKTFDTIEEFIKWDNNSYGIYYPFLEKDLGDQWETFMNKSRHIWYKGHRGFRYNGTNYKRYMKAQEKAKSPYAYVTR